MPPPLASKSRARPPFAARLLFRVAGRVQSCRARAAALGSVCKVGPVSRQWKGRPTTEVPVYTWSNDRSHLCRTIRIRPGLADPPAGSGTQHHALRRRAAGPVFTCRAAPAAGSLRSWAEPGRSLPVLAGAIELRTFVSVMVDRRTARVGVEEWFRNRGGGLAGGDYPHPLSGKAVFADVSLFLGNRELRNETMSTCNARASAGSVCPWCGPAPGRTIDPMRTARRTRNGRLGLTLSHGGAAGKSPARGVAIVLDVSGSMACAGVDRARQAVRRLFRTPGVADRFRSSPSNSGIGRRSSHRQPVRAGSRPPGAPGKRGRSARGTPTGRGVRIGRTERRSSQAGSPALALGSVLVLRMGAVRGTGEPGPPAGHEPPAPVHGRPVRDTARRGCPPDEYTTHLVQEPLDGGGIPRAGRTVCP